MGSGILPGLRGGAAPRPLPASSETGAAAVEFALVSVVFFLVLFGIVQYGLFFNDSLNTRQGVREAVRQGVVQMPFANSCGAAGFTWTKLECYTDQEVGSVLGPPKVHFAVPDSGGWKKRNRLIVCAAVKPQNAFGILPMPNGGVVRSRTAMSIEQDAVAPGNPPNGDADPSGANWAWCT
jgi:hypothetical protein